MNLSLVSSCLADALLDTLRSVPFLFFSYLILEAISQKNGNFSKVFNRHRQSGPFFGALLGLLPQCGFSTMITGLFCGGSVTLGTLLAVYLATSDEAIILMFSHAGSAAVIGKLLLTKFLFALCFGFLTDFVIRFFRLRRPRIRDFGNNGARSGLGIVRPALRHTARLAIILFVISFFLGLLMESFGIEALSRLFMHGHFGQVFLTALVGLIPHCAASVLLTELYLDGVISFASVISGLCTGAGVGLIVLFRTNKKKKECFSIVALLYAFAVSAGLILSLF